VNVFLELTGHPQNATAQAGAATGRRFPARREVRDLFKKWTPTASVK